MNEFKWSREYSRSIGVDVRYILWLVGTSAYVSIHTLHPLRSIGVDVRYILWLVGTSADVC